MNRILLIFALCLAGCAQKEPPWEVRTALEVRQALRQHGLHGMAYTPDESYILPSDQWLDRFAIGWKAEVQQQGAYQSEANDCEDFARAAAVFAQRMAPKEVGHGLAFGELWYRRGDGVAHAVNVAVTSNGLRFWEPNPGMWVRLTRGETERADNIQRF